MKRYNTAYYLLSVLLILGSFASMAQNDYGSYILGLVTFGFAFLFLIQFIQSFSREGSDSVLINRLEFMGLFLLSSIMGMRIFFVRFSYVEILFVVGGLIVMIMYSFRMFRFFTSSPDRGKGINLFVGFYYSSIVFYLLSMILVPFLPVMAEPAGGIGFGLLLGFIVLSFARKTILVNGNKIIPIQYVGAFKDRSVLLLSLFLMFTFYMGFTKIGVIPKMYSDAYPQQYFNLVNKAETGQNEDDSRKVLHEEFKEEYDRFIERLKSDEN